MSSRPEGPSLRAVPTASRTWKVAELERLATSGLDVAAFQTEALRRLRSLITIDAAFFATVDPETLLFTGASAEEPLLEAASLFLDNEFGRDDVNKFASLARAGDPVSSLDVATRGDRANSARFRDVMAPLGLGDELRVALMSRRQCWGVLCLHRGAATAGFDDDEIALVRRVAPLLAAGIRRGIAVAAASRDDPAPPDGAGVIVLGPDLAVVSINGPAERWLDDIAGEWPSNLDVPVPVIAAAARVIAPGLGGPVESAVARLPSKRGGWISVQASHLRGGGQDQVVVLLQPATTQEVSSMVLAAYGLTPAQHRVAALVLQGRSTAEIVDTLQISTHTLQEHLRAVFDRFGVGSRRELVAALMA
jgi:DNA-binding CsgD family transcriptional regulator